MVKISDTINGKTPDEIKKGLECYRAKHPYSIGRCPEGCPYEKDGASCRSMLNADALAYIQHLESRLAQSERERDAAVKELKNMAFNADFEDICDTCARIACRERMTGTKRIIKKHPCCDPIMYKWRGPDQTYTEEME